MFLSNVFIRFNCVFWIIFYDFVQNLFNIEENKSSNLTSKIFNNDFLYNFNFLLNNSDFLLNQITIHFLNEILHTQEYDI